jgi:HSP20 family protein
MANRGLTPRNGSREVAPYSRDPFSAFRREMDQLFDNFFAPSRSRNGERELAGSWPSVDVQETDAAYSVTAERPGLDANDVEVNLRDSCLTISGEKRREERGENAHSFWSERSFGRFERTIPFDVEIDADRIEAGYKNGVLTVTLPKSEQAQDRTRKIEIKPN